MTLLGDLFELDNCVQRIMQSAGMQEMPRLIMPQPLFAQLLRFVEADSEVRSMQPAMCNVSKDRNSLCIQKLRIQPMIRPHPIRLVTPNGDLVPVGEMGVVWKIVFSDQTTWDGDKGWTS